MSGLLMRLIVAAAAIGAVFYVLYICVFVAILAIS